jgi:RNA polymerase sigma factor (sigma-70 family)
VSIHDDAVTRAAPAEAPSSAFEPFFRAQFPGVVAFVTVLIGDREVAAELAQEAMWRAYRDWDRISRYDRPDAWTRRVAGNLARSTRKRREVERRAVERAAVQSRPAGEGPEIDEELWRVVRKLPRRQREAVALFYLEDWSVRDLASFFGCAEATARVHLHKGRARLARELGVEP